MPSRPAARLVPAAVLAALLLTSVPPPALAQLDDDPLRSLKPSLGDEVPGMESRASGDVPEEGGAAPDQAVPDVALGERDDRAAAGEGERTEAARPPDELAGSTPEPPRTVRLGVIAGRDLMTFMSRIEPVAEDLGRILGRSVELLPMSSYQAMIDAQVQQRIDGGFYSALAFAAAESGCRCLEPIAAPMAFDGTAAFHAVILAPAGSGIASAADLEGKVVAAGAADSVGHRRMQLAGLISEGFDPGRFAAVRDVESGADAVRLMLSGDADAAFAWSSLAGDREGGFSRGTIADLVAAGEIKVGDVEIIWRSPAIPHGPVAVLQTLPDADKARIESYLLGLETANPVAYDALNPFYSGGYATVEPSDYRPLDLLASGKIDEVSLPSAPLGGSRRPATDGPKRR